MRYKLGWSRLILAALWVTAVSAAPASTVSAASIPSALAFTPVASGLSLPVFVTNAGDGSNRLFIVQQGGQIRIFKNGSLLPTPFLNIVGSVSNFTGVNVEQGLLCLVFDPNYSTNGTFYITYTTTNPDPTFIYTTTLARYHVSTGNPDVADVASGVVLLSIPKKYTNHNGGMLAFGPDGYLYMSMGDGGSGGDPDNNAQNLHTMLGKLLRLDVESTPPVGKMYVIPPTNPFFASSDPNVKQEIWAYGLRNPWRFSFDRLTGDLYIGDVGQATEEEVDFQASASAGGQDYGWHILEGNLCYSPSVGCVAPSGYVPPVATYDHGVNASFGCAITGGYVYRGGASPSLQGVYLYGDYCSGKVLGLVKNASSIWTSSLIVSTGFTISSFGQDEQGELYLADYGGGTIYRISAPWIGGVSLTSDRNVVAVGRPQIGSQVMAYDGFATGNTTFYVPMLFRNAFGGTYNAALYVQNVDPVNTANITLSYYDTSGNLTCSHADSIPAFSSHGYWMPSECVPDGWVGGVVITADHNVVAVGRPQIGAEITSYDGFPSGSTSMYVPMLFRNAFGGTYNAALYVQNTDPSNTANITIQYYDTSGNPTCSHMDTIPALASHGYWLPTECMPDSWVGGAVVTADHNIVAVGRPHIGGQVTAYDGFSGGATSADVPMMYKRAGGGTFNAALYVQDLDPVNSAAITLDFYDRTGTLTCTTSDTIPALSSHGYWTPAIGCLPDGWTGGVVVSADHNVVALGRPHFGGEIFAYDGFSGGSLSSSVPMLFANAFGGSYNAGYYLQNLDPSNTANLTIKYYDVNGALTCTTTAAINPLAARDVWVPDDLAANCP